MFYATALTNMITDMCILTIPLPMIWKLQMPTQQKIAVSGIFLLGALWASHHRSVQLSGIEGLFSSHIRSVCGISIARFVFFVQAGKGFANAYDVTCKSIVHPYGLFVNFYLQTILLQPYTGLNWREPSLLSAHVFPHFDHFLEDFLPKASSVISGAEDSLLVKARILRVSAPRSGAHRSASTNRHFLALTETPTVGFLIAALRVWKWGIFKRHRVIREMESWITRNLPFKARTCRLFVVDWSVSGIQWVFVASKCHRGTFVAHSSKSRYLTGHNLGTKALWRTKWDATNISNQIMGKIKLKYTRI